MKDSTKFVNANFVRLVLKLFVEYDDTKELAQYTLAKTDKEVDGVVYPSLYRLYMEEADVTEARFVEKYLYDQEQWDRLCRNSILKEEIERWRQDLRAKVAGKLVDELMSDAFSGSKSSMSSAKYLLDHVVKPDKTRTNKGRPRKEESDLAVDQKRNDNDVVADLERITKLKSGNGSS